MNSLAATVRKNPQFFRRLAQIISGLLLAFILLLILFNDDVLDYPTWQFLLYTLVILSLLMAWRWERNGGLLAMAGGLLFGLFLLVNALLQNDLNLLLALFGSAMLSLPCFSAGWLFYTLGQQSKMAVALDSE